MSDFWQKNKQSIIIYGGMIVGFILLVILATATQSGYPYNKVAIDTPFGIGNFEFDVRWYAIFILTGIIFAGILAYVEFKRFGEDPEKLFDGLLYGVPISILGARLWYLMFNPTTSFFDFQDGGLAIHGAIVLMFIFVIFFTKWKKLSFWWLLDVVAPGFLIGQAMGRWGNFMNAELYGPATDSLNWLPAFIREQMYIGGSYHLPTFLFESMWNLLGLVIILILRRKRIFKLGDTIGLYFVWYGIIRIPMELLRLQGDPYDPLPLPWLESPVTAWWQMTSLWTSVLLIIGGLSIIVFKRVFAKDLPYYVDFESENEQNETDTI